MANNDLVGAVVKAMALVKIVSTAQNGMKLNELAIFTTWIRRDSAADMWSISPC